MTNRFGVMVFEIAEKDMVASHALGLYLQDVCMQEEYPVIGMEDYLTVLEKLSPEKIPNPEQWYRTR